MKHEIQDTTPQPPEQRVTLDMSVEEFAVIYALAYRHNGGNPLGLRGDVEHGLNEALASLHPDWRARVSALAPTKKGSFGLSPADYIEQNFHAEDAS